MTTKAAGFPAPGERPPNHEYANLFPMLNQEHLEELARDIKANGQREAIVILEGKILDGRNRCDAALSVKVEPFYRFYDPRQDGHSPLSFVLSRNLKRRHLTMSQAATVAAEALPMFEEEAKHRQQASGKAHAANLKKTATTSSPAPAAPNGHADTTGELATKAPDYVKAVDLIKTGVPVTVNELIAKIHVGHQRAVQIMEELGRNGMLSGGDEFDQRTHGSESTGHEEPTKKGGKKPAASKPSKTMAAAIATAKPAAKKPEPKPKAARATTAAAAAGKALGVSERSVRDAKKLKAEAPEKFEEVKAGKKTVAAAKKEAERESTEVQDALGRISKICGRSLGDAVREGTRLPKVKDILAYAALSDEEMLRTRGLIDAGWDVKRAVAYKAGALTRTHRLHDLVDRAAASGGTFSLELEGYRIDVIRLDLAKGKK